MNTPSKRDQKTLLSAEAAKAYNIAKSRGADQKLAAIIKADGPSGREPIKRCPQFSISITEIDANLDELKNQKAQLVENSEKHLEEIKRLREQIKEQERLHAIYSESDFPSDRVGRDYSIINLCNRQISAHQDARKEMQKRIYVNDAKQRSANDLKVKILNAREESRKAAKRQQEDAKKRKELAERQKAEKQRLLEEERENAGIFQVERYADGSIKSVNRLK